MDKGAGAGTGLTTADGIDDHWTVDSYALIFLITHIDSDGDASGLETTKPIFNVMSMYPFNNSHSQLIEITDPMHISLNKYMISQSVSFTRKGKYQEIDTIIDTNQEIDQYFNQAAAYFSKLIDSKDQNLTKYES